VQVTFAPNDGVTNYAAVSTLFPMQLKISNRQPTLLLSPKEVLYDGKMQNSNIATIAEMTDGEALKGTFSYSYALDKTSSYTENNPVNAGIYNVKVTFTAGAGCNYGTVTVIFASALYIKAATLYVSPVSDQKKIYNGSPVAHWTTDENGYATEDRIIQFIYWGTLGASPFAGTTADAQKNHFFTGCLSAGESSTAGKYSIDLHTLSAGSNYDIVFTKGIFYTIEQKVLQFIFEDINPVYDGAAKTPRILIDPFCLIQGDENTVFIKAVYEGNNVNAGNFIARAQFTAKPLNYKMPNPQNEGEPPDFFTYTISPAKMSGNTFVSRTETYTGDIIRMEVSTIFAGASVVYRNSAGATLPTQFVNTGVYAVTAYITKANYAPETLTATLTIVKAQHNVTVKLAEETGILRYGDDLPALSCTGVTAADGSVSFNAGQQLAVGERYYKWTYIPRDTNNYKTIEGEILLKVEQAMLFINNAAADGKTVSVVDKNGMNVDSVTVTVTYTDKHGKESLSVPVKAGRYTRNVTVDGGENMQSTTYTDEFVIKAKFNVLWLLCGIGALILLLVAAKVVHSVRKKPV
jgi:hypothetical protein